MSLNFRIVGARRPVNISFAPMSLCFIIIIMIIIEQSEKVSQAGRQAGGRFSFERGKIFCNGASRVKIFFLYYFWKIL